MSKSTDVTLNIKARNLAGKTLDEINAQVEQLAKNNDAQATSAQKAARSMRDLNDTSRQLAGAYNELARREGLTRAFVQQQKEVEATARRLAELTASYRALGKGADTSANRQAMIALEQEIIDTNAALQRMVRDNDKAAAALGKIGVSARTVDADLARIRDSVARAGDAYKASEADVASYAATQQRAAEVAAEAAHRQSQATQEQERAANRLRAIGQRRSELDELRADIEARSAAARATDVQAEAQRRLSAEQVEAATKQERATQAIREAIAATEANSAARRRDAAAAFGGTVVADGQEMSAKQRLIAALRNLVPQRGQARNAAVQESDALRQNTAETDRNAAAKEKAATNLALFSDVGRKSLGTYQRLRGQILGLTAAYIGFYQVINTAQKAIAATNRNQTLMVGLRTVNNGDAAAAASDYRFLRQEAERLGLVFDDLAPQYANIAIAGKAIGMNTTQLRDMFSDTAQAAASMNLSVADTEGVFRAMTQIMSKGKVQAEELRGQLGDRLPGAVVMFAKANKIALADLEDRLKKGTIGVDFLMRGIAGYARQYDAEIENVSNRLQGYINRATNAYNDFLRSLLTGANDAKLKAAFQRISDFFKSQEGQAFASKLADAFGKAIDIFIALANNIDLVTEAVKIFIGIQLLKFLNDTVIGVVALSGHLKTAGQWMLGLNTAQRAAAASSATLAGRMALLGASMGPIVGVLSLLAIGFSQYTRRVEEATKRTEDYAKTLGDLTFAQNEVEFTDAISAGRDELKKLTAEVEALERAAPLKSPLARSAVLRDSGVAETLRTQEQVEKALQVRRERLTNVTYGLVNAQLKLDDAIAKREAREAKERAAPLPTLDPEDKDGKDGEKERRNAENRRLTAARAIAKEMLDLDQAVFDARIDGEVRTAAQIQQNYQLTVDKIASETEERYLKLQQLAQAAFAAHGINTPAPETGDARADFEAMVAAAERLGLAEAANLRVAGERVEMLRLARNDKALEKSETQDIEVIERQINDLLDQRNSKVEYFNTMRDAGLISEIDAYNAINATQDGYNQRIRALVETILPLLKAIDKDDPRFSWAQKLIADFDILLVKQRTYTLGQKAMLQQGAAFASGAADAIVQLGRGIADAARNISSWGDAIKAARDVFLNFAADFLQQIAQMILQAIIFQAIQNAINGTSGGYWSAAMGALAGTNHTGGIVSGAGSGPKRKVNAAVFAGAQRFHTGGLPGLRSGEVATILKKGEEVLPETNPRHIANAGQESGGGITQVIATFDPADVVIRALGDTGVRKRLFAFFNQNKNQINRSTGR